MALPAIPEPTSVGANTATFDLEGLHGWDAYIVVAETNKQIADENAQTILAQKRAINGLVEAGKAQRQVAEIRLQMLEDERRRSLWNSITYWVVIGALGAAVISN
jgi:uncharacterized protein (DUF608 family)